MAKAAELAVLLTLKDAASPGMKAAGDNATDLGGKFKAAGLIAGGALVAAGAAAGAFAVASVKSFADAGSAVQDMAQRTGLSTEAISELKHAADLSGTSIEGLETGFRRMQRSLFDAEQGTAEAVDALAALGFKFQDLAGLKPEEQFNRLTNALAGIEDPTRKAALAQELFGRSGTALLPMLADGAAGLAAMRQEAHELGVVFDAETAAAAEAFGDNLDRLGIAFDGIKFAIAREIMPVLDDLVNRLRGALPAALHAIQIAFNVIGPPIAKAVELLGNIKEGAEAATDRIRKYADALAFAMPKQEAFNDAIQEAPLILRIMKREEEILGRAMDTLGGMFEEAGIMLTSRLVPGFDAATAHARTFGLIAVEATDVTEILAAKEAELAQASDILAAKLQTAQGATEGLTVAEEAQISFLPELLRLQAERNALMATENASIAGLIPAHQALALAQREITFELNEGAAALGNFGSSLEAWYSGVVRAESAARNYGQAVARMRRTLGETIPIPGVNMPAPSVVGGEVPRFQFGGIVPGPVGAPRLVMAHGGEAITPPRQAGAKVLTVNFNGPVYGMLDFAQRVKAILRDAVSAGGFPELARS